MDDLFWEGRKAPAQMYGVFESRGQVISPAVNFRIALRRAVLVAGSEDTLSPFRDTVERPSSEIKAQASSRSYLQEKTFRERPEGARRRLVEMGEPERLKQAASRGPLPKRADL